MYDLTIIGAGPAGSTLARLVGQRYRVLLVDKRPTFGAPDCASSCKCCGGLLAPDAQRLLSKLGLGLPREVLVSPQIFVVRAIDLPSGLERYYQRFYLNMDRGRFDAWLLSLTPPEAEVRLGCRLAALSRRGDHLELTLKENQGFSTERPRLLVGADGAFSRVRRLAFPRCRSTGACAPTGRLRRTARDLRPARLVGPGRMAGILPARSRRRRYLHVGTALAKRKDA